jgi:hypothetical protein
MEALNPVVSRKTIDVCGIFWGYYMLEDKCRRDNL